MIQYNSIMFFIRLLRIVLFPMMPLLFLIIPLMLIYDAVEWVITGDGYKRSEFYLIWYFEFMINGSFYRGSTFEHNDVDLYFYEKYVGS